MYCPNCNKEFDGKFCPDCGTMLVEKATSKVEYNTKVGVFETGKKDAQGGAYEGNRFLALRDRKLEAYQVKDGVEVIGDRAFYDAKVERVVLPDSLKAIGQSAFAGCKHLADVNIPEGVELIKETAFRDCESLTEITLPETLLKVEARAFGPALKRLVVLSENTLFDSRAFKQVKELEEILVPASVVGKYSVLFEAMGVKAQVVALQEETADEIPYEEDEFEEVDDDVINECQQTGELADKSVVEKIREHICALEMNEFVLYTSDYCGDLDWDDVNDKVCDSNVSLDLYFELHDSFDGSERTHVAPRKIRVVNESISFDVEEVWEHEDGDVKTIAQEEDLSVADIVERYGASSVNQCLTAILNHINDANVIELNKNDNEDISVTTEVLENNINKTEENTMEKVSVKAVIKYDVEGDLYGKIVFAYDNQYCVYDENWGDVEFESVKDSADSIDLDNPYYELGVAADVPVSECKQEIINAYLNALDDEGELEYLDDPSSTYLDY